MLYRRYRYHWPYRIHGTNGPDRSHGPNRSNGLDGHHGSHGHYRSNRSGNQCVFSKLYTALYSAVSRNTKWKSNRMGTLFRFGRYKGNQP